MRRVSSHKPKILHFIDSGGLYGAESVILNLSREMIAHEKYEPLIGCIVNNKEEPNDLFSKAGELGIKAIKISINNALLFIDIPKAAISLKKMHIDLVHCHGYKAFVFAFFISLLIRVPIVSTCHLWFLRGKVPLRMRLMVKLELFLYRFSSLVVGVSDAIKEFLVGAGIKFDTIKVINNGIRIGDYQGYEEGRLLKLSQDLKLNVNAFVVLNVGRLTAQKAQERIVEAAALLQGSGIEYRFLIVGDGELREQLQKVINDKKLESVVTLMGFSQGIRDLLFIADLFLLPSLDEGMPMSLLEAVASGTPVIATPVGDIPKLIRHEQSGFIIPKNDPEAISEAVRQLQADRRKCERMAQSAFLILQKEYSSQRMYKQYEKVVYDSMVDFQSRDY